MQEHWLECQQCSYRLRKLTQQQAKMVAENPYNYVVYCPECTKDILKQLEREEYG